MIDLTEILRKAYNTTHNHLYEVIILTNLESCIFLIKRHELYIFHQENGTFDQTLGFTLLLFRIGL